MAPIYPTGNAGLPPDTPLRFAWKPFTGATNYLMHIWLVKQTGSVVITPTTPITLSTIVFGHTTFIWKNHGFLPGAYEYSLLPEDSYGNVLAPWSPAVQINLYGN